MLRISHFCVCVNEEHVNAAQRRIGQMYSEDKRDTRILKNGGVLFKVGTRAQAAMLPFELTCTRVKVPFTDWSLDPKKNMLTLPVADMQRSIDSLRFVGYEKRKGKGVILDSLLRQSPAPSVSLVEGEEKTLAHIGFHADTYDELLSVTEKVPSAKTELGKGILTALKCVPQAYQQAKNWRTTVETGGIPIECSWGVLVSGHEISYAAPKQKKPCSGDEYGREKYSSPSATRTGNRGARRLATWASSL